MRVIYSYLIVTLTLLFILSSCEGENGNGNSLTKNNPTPLPIANSQGTAQLGNLANARVKIYKIENSGKKTLLWKEETSAGDSLDKIGKFNLHNSSLEDDTFYLYEVSGGEDWDADDNGVKDNTYTQNKGKIRAIAKGSDIKALAKDFRVTAISEILYEKVALTLKYHFDKNSFENILNSNAKTILPNKSLQDLLSFNPVNDKNGLEDLYKAKFNEIITTIHQGKYPLLRLSSILNFTPIIGVFNIKGTMAYSVTLSKDETKAFVAYWYKGLVILDITNPSKPIKIGSFNPKGIIPKKLKEGLGATTYVTLSKDGTKAFIADHLKGLVIVDITNPSNPTKIGSYSKGIIHSVTLSKDETKAFLANIAGGLIIVDITNPSHPTTISSFSTKGIVNSITLSKDETKAFIADSRKGLIILDITNPSKPTKISSFSTKGSPRCVTLSKDETKAFVADGYKGLVILDITNPSKPIKIGSFLIAGDIKRVTLSKDETKAFLANYNNSKNGLVIVDITNPSHPIKINSFPTKGNPLEVTLSTDETKAYIANGMKGVVVLDLAIFE